MGKVRFRLWFHKLTINIRIKGVHHIKIKRSLPALINAPPANLAYSHSLVQYNMSNSTTIQLSSPVNHKALDIPYPCTSPARRSPSHSNSPKMSPLLPIAPNLLNSPLMAHPVISRSQPVHPPAGRNSRSGAKSHPASIRREVRSSAVDCGCRPSLASSFRKTKENLQACSTGGVQSSSKDPLRQAKKAQLQEGEVASFTYFKGKEIAGKSTQVRAAGQKPESSHVEKKEDSDTVASLSVNNANNKKHRKGNLHRKLQYDNAMVEEAACKQDSMIQKVNPSHNGPMQAKLQEDDLTRDGGKVKTSEYSMEELGKLEPTSSDNFRLSCSSSLADSAVLDAHSFNLGDKEFSSFTSTEDTFFSSFERSRPSFSSNSSSDVFDKMPVIDHTDIKMGMGHKKLPQGSFLSGRDHGHSRKVAEGVPSFRLSDFEQADLDSMPPLNKPGKGLLHQWSTNDDKLNGSGKRTNRSLLSHGACSFSASAESTDHGLDGNTKSTSKCAASESNDGIKGDIKVCHDENMNVASAENLSPSSANSCRSDTGDGGDDVSSTNSCSNQFCDSTTRILNQSKGSRRRKKYTKRGGGPNSIRRRAQLQAKWNLSENQIHWQLYSDDPLSSSVSSTPNPALARRIRGNSWRKEHNQQQDTASTDGEEDFSIGISKLNEKFGHMSKGTASSTRVKESVAVVKSSRDPLVDFRDSMVDMILEKQIYSASELEELLQCFLALNSADQHDTIVRAFTQVWEKVFDNLKSRSRTCSL